MRGALRDADRRAVELLHLVDAGVAADGEALAVVEIHRPLVQAERGVAQEGLRAVAVQHVDLAGLQRGEARLRGQRGEAHLGGVAQHRRGQRAAVVGIEAAILAAAVGCGEPREALGDAAVQHAALLDRGQGLRAGAAEGRRRRRPPPESMPSSSFLLYLAAGQRGIDRRAEAVDDHVDLVGRDDIGRRQDGVVAEPAVDRAAHRVAGQAAGEGLRA